MRYLTAAFMAVALSACASSGTEVKENQLAQFRPGITTEAQVERVLGPPQASTVAPTGTRVITYAYGHAQANGASFIPIVGLFAGGGTAKGSAVTFRFDSQGRLLDYSSSSSNTDVRTGIVNGAH